eukprot:Rhum_TRINITY_DN4274_c0_g1::Rhum_TRINITY_DN4274_c0_g1_i1::g.13678::m.13678
MKPQAPRGGGNTPFIFSKSLFAVVEATRGGVARRRASCLLHLVQEAEDALDRLPEVALPAVLHALRLAVGDVGVDDLHLRRAGLVRVQRQLHQRVVVLVPVVQPPLHHEALRRVNRLERALDRAAQVREGTALLQVQGHLRPRVGAGLGGVHEGVPELGGRAAPVHAQLELVDAAVGLRLLLLLLGLLLRRLGGAVVRDGRRLVGHAVRVLHQRRELPDALPHELPACAAHLGDHKLRSVALLRARHVHLQVLVVRARVVDVRHRHLALHGVDDLTRLLVLHGALPRDVRGHVEGADQLLLAVHDDAVALDVAHLRRLEVDLLGRHERAVAQGLLQLRLRPRHDVLLRPVPVVAVRPILAVLHNPPGVTAPELSHP